MSDDFDSRYYEKDEDGFICGKDPRKLSTQDLLDLGVESSFKRMIRRKCLDCCNDSQKEVRLCTAIRCPLWAFRMGNNPLHGKTGKEE